MELAARATKFLFVFSCLFPNKYFVNVQCHFCIAAAAFLLHVSWWWRHCLSCHDENDPMVVMLKWKYTFTTFILISRVDEQPERMSGPSCYPANSTGVRTDMNRFKSAIHSETWVLYSTCCLVRCRFAFDSKRSQGNRITDNGVSSLMQLRLLNLLGETTRECVQMFAGLNCLSHKNPLASRTALNIEWRPEKPFSEKYFRTRWNCGDVFLIFAQAAFESKT